MGIFGKSFESKSTSSVSGGGKRVTTRSTDGSSEDRTYDKHGKAVDITCHGKDGSSHSHDVNHGLLGPSKGSIKSSSSGGSGSSGGCFLTTACVQHKGLEDDCTELKVLRSFRDTFVRRLPDGHHILETYYSESPNILRGIEQCTEDEQHAIYDSIYHVVQRAVSLITDQQEQEAYVLYRRLFEDLQRRHNVLAYLSFHRTCAKSRAGR